MEEQVGDCKSNSRACVGAGGGGCVQEKAVRNKAEKIA